ncbi:MAG: hypothetical protein AB7J35_01880 [Dehalococcoidia bacterium]
MTENEEIRDRVHALASRITELSAELAALGRRKEFEQELHDRGNWLAKGSTTVPPWAEKWNEYWDGLRKDPTHIALVTEYESVKAKLHSPEFESAIDGMKSGDAAGAEYAVAYLEADPWFFRSGYLKGTIARRLRRVELSAGQQERLRSALLAAIAKGSRFEFVEYRKLARRVETPEFRNELRRLSESRDTGIARRAGLTLRFCEMNDTPGRDLRGAR